MRPELPTVSFFCAMLLIGLAPLHLQARNVAMASLILWLFVCNVIQGVNSVIWSGNTIIRSSVWCDISTKFLQGANIALPAACTCICLHLHFLSSNHDARARRHRTLLECFLCIMLPFLYVALYTITQDYRFDLTEDFGCTYSTSASVPAIILVWVPPLILCVTSFVFAVLALWSHIHLQPLSINRTRASTRMLAATFLRPLLIAAIISCLIIAGTIFDLYTRLTAGGGVQPWISWSNARSHWSTVRIIPQTSGLDLVRIELSWWIVPAASLVVFTLTLVGFVWYARRDTFGGYRSVGKWFRTTVLRQALEEDEFIQAPTNFSSHIILQAPSAPLSVHLKSGWDDSLRPSKGLQLKTNVARDEPTSLSSPTDSESDASFKASTLSYLDSPTGREALGFSAQQRQPSSCVTPPTRAFLPPSTLYPGESASASPTQSILSSPWPQPPSTIPVSPTRSPQASPIRQVRGQERPRSGSSLTTSMASSTVSTGAYMYDPEWFSQDPRRAPFQDASIPAPTGIVPPVPRHTRRTPSKETLPTRNLGLSVKRGVTRSRRHRDGSDGEAVYMTVVQETHAF